MQQELFKGGLIVSNRHFFWRNEMGIISDSTIPLDELVKNACREYTRAILCKEYPYFWIDDKDIFDSRQVIDAANDNFVDHEGCEDCISTGDECTEGECFNCDMRHQAHKEIATNEPDECLQAWILTLCNALKP